MKSLLVFLLLVSPVSAPELSGSRFRFCLKCTMVLDSSDMSFRVESQDEDFSPPWPRRGAAERRGGSTNIISFLNSATPRRGRRGGENASPRSGLIGTALVSAQTKPEIRVSPASVQSGASLVVAGTGFTPDRTVMSHLLRPDGSEYNPLRIRINERGEFSHRIDTTMLDIGTFELWVEDEASGVVSNRVRFTVTPAIPPVRLF